MEKSTFGKIISRYQKKYNLKQTKIYEGICSPASYQRAVTQERDVDFMLLETLIARVGREAANFELYLSDEDWELKNERLAVSFAFARKDYDSAEKIIEGYRNKIKRYKNKKSGKHKLHQQFCQYYEMKLAEEQGESSEKICQCTTGALKLTKGIEGAPNIKDNLYTPLEMELLLTLIAHRYGKWQNTRKCEISLLEIIEYAEHLYSLENRETIQGKAWIELVRVTEQYLSPAELLSYIDKAIASSSSESGIGRLGTARFIRARILKRMGDEQGCKEECKMAYCIFEVLGWNKELQEVIKYCEEESKWPITTQIWW